LMQGEHNPKPQLLCGGSERFNEELYDEVCRLRCVSRERGVEVMYLMAADELVKLRSLIESRTEPQ